MKPTSPFLLGTFRYERKTQPLLPHRLFVRRLLRSALLSVLLILFSLAVGMLGYHGLERLGWLDAFLNAAMIMSGMGPVATVQTSAGKLFAGCYALYCGFALITASVLMITPLFHRFLHRFNLADEAAGKST